MLQGGELVVIYCILQDVTGGRGGDNKLDII